MGYPTAAIIIVIADIQGLVEAQKSGDQFYLARWSQKWTHGEEISIGIWICLGQFRWCAKRYCNVGLMKIGSDIQWYFMEML